MNRNPEVNFNLERFSASIPIEWLLTPEHQKDLSKILKTVYKKGGKVWGAITKDRILLGDSNAVYQINPDVLYREFSVNKIDNVPSEITNETKNQVYAALHNEPTSLSEIFEINLTTEEEFKLRTLLLKRISLEVDQKINE